MKKKTIIQALGLALLIAGTLWIARQERVTPYQHHEGLIFGTSYSVTYQSNDDLSALIKAELLQVDTALSMFNKESIISAVNNNEDVEVTKKFEDVFKLAMQVSKDTEGAFDITVAPLVNAWGFGFKNNAMPTDSQVDSLRQFIGYQKVRMQQKHIVKDDPRLMLDCSAIAKGYGTDCVASLLARKGVENYMVEIGGEVVTHGVNPKREAWRIGVSKPTDDSLAVNNELQTVLELKNQALATSGNYRNFYYKGGKKYAHTIDPKSGRPVQHSLLSATVLAPTCAMADAYATAFMVMGMEKAKELLKRHSELKAYFIYDKNGELIMEKN